MMAASLQKLRSRQRCRCGRVAVACMQRVLICISAGGRGEATAHIITWVRMHACVRCAVAAAGGAQAILDAPIAAPSVPGGSFAVLTAHDRDSWARARTALLAADPVNVAPGAADALDHIESAILHVCLDQVSSQES
jgi:hypothetical protein